MLQSATLNKESRRTGLAGRIGRLSDWAHAHWKLLTILAWIIICGCYLYDRYPAIYWLALNDTDDNSRFVQVKDWLAGQGWFDLTQYRLDPPHGANIHWSRIVDLPIAGLMLLFRLVMTPDWADRWAVGIAPLLPLLPAMLALGFVMRRIVGGNSWIIAILAPLSADMALSMFMPMRIDHHGWQLAMLLVTLAGLADERPARGGLVAGLSSAVSVAIGMEMIVYLAATGAVVALRWVAHDGENARMRAYAAGLAAGVATGFLGFASYANRAPVCDALSPIWLSILSAAAAGMVLLTLLPLAAWRARLAAGVAVAVILGGWAWFSWPQCLSGAYSTISPELQRLWLDNIREAKPIYRQSREVVVPLLALPIPGMAAAIVASWVYRRKPERFWPWLTVAMLSVFAFALLFWQTRVGPAAQLLAIPGACALAYWAARAFLTRKGWKLKVAALSALAVTGTAFAAYYVSPDIVPQKPTARSSGIRSANARCRSLPALQALDSLPPATIFTMVDLGPRILATTHHSAVAGPYHRNGGDILDIHHAFDGSPEQFRAIAGRHHARYLLICPDFPEGTVYQARSPRGFYAQMINGKVPSWLVPVELGKDLPYRLYRIDYEGQSRR